MEQVRVIRGRQKRRTRREGDQSEGGKARRPAQHQECIQQSAAPVAAVLDIIRALLAERTRDGIIQTICKGLPIAPEEELSEGTRVAAVRCS